MLSAIQYAPLNLPHIIIYNNNNHITIPIDVQIKQIINIKMHSKIMLYQPIITEYITDFSNLVVRTPYIYLKIQISIVTPQKLLLNNYRNDD